MKISTDKAIESILYAVAKKTEMGLDVEACVNVARTDLLGIWSDDMSQIERELFLLTDG